jgi:hypothetical protein
MTFVGKRRVWDMTGWPPVEVTDKFSGNYQVPEFSDDGARVITTDVDQHEWQLRETESMSLISRGSYSAQNAGICFADKDRWLFVRQDSAYAVRWLHDWLRHYTGFRLFNTYRGQFIDAKSSLRSRTTPLFWPQQFTTDGAAVWGSLPKAANQVRYELWSLNPPQPPWWLWLLTAIVGAWYLYRIWQSRNRREGKGSRHDGRLTTNSQS